MGNGRGINYILNDAMVDNLHLLSFLLRFAVACVHLLHCLSTAQAPLASRAHVKKKEIS